MRACPPSSDHLCYTKRGCLDDGANHHDDRSKQDSTLPAKSFAQGESRDGSKEASNIIQRGHGAHHVCVAFQFESIKEVFRNDHTACKPSVLP